VDELREAAGSPGALGVLVDGEDRLAAASGTLDLEGTRPATPEARFRIASITKPIVAALVLTAVDRGELDLDATVADLLPGVLRPDPPITVRQVLAHTSGVFDEGNEGDPIADMKALADPALQAEARDLAARSAAGEHVIASDRLLVALAETHDRYFAPGTGYHYSNINYQIAAMLVETATGQSIADVLRSRIVEPLGLRHTTIAPPDLASPDLRGYDAAEDGTTTDVTDDLLAFGNGGNGGIVTTADELLAILRAVVGGELFGADLVTQMETPVRESYGLGLGTTATGCGRFHGHSGSVNGTRSVALVSPDGALGIVLAYNLRSTREPNAEARATGLLCARR
jgi:D-alanyl-D-alanine carboxypeptidase